MSGIPGGGGFIGASLPLWGTGIQAHWNRQAAEDNRAWEYRMWNENNAYNAPAAQRARLIAGGYNPQLALPNSGNSSGMPHAAPRQPTQVPNLDGVIDRIYSAAMMKKQMEVMDAQIAATKQQTALNGVRETHELKKEAKTTSEINQLNALYNVNIDSAHQALQALTLGNRARQLEIDYLPIKQKQEVAESMARLENMKSQLTAQELANQIQREAMQWRIAGMSSADAAKLVTQFLSILTP